MIREEKLVELTTKQIGTLSRERSGQFPRVPAVDGPVVVPAAPVPSSPPPPDRTTTGAAWGCTAAATGFFSVGTPRPVLSRDGVYSG